MRLHRADGVTLAELLIAVAILAIMASIALPQYGRVTERGYWRSARDLLQAIYSGEQVYQTTKNAYVDADDAAACAPIWRCIYMDDPTGTIPVTFTVTVSGGPPPDAFVATATRNGGPNDGKKLTIDQDRGNPGEDWPMP